ncbi:hypothetical protein BGZ65_011891 [Modicella reniformis]|uniref:RING-type domain-containing protein n=1 Tax=Modicella reniformis TaxID=1440133 RepID=A0A9P6SRA8_9FUNG|nr:hypothetical protein BGZ65_011891 [Modicella reniformis]
MQSAVRRIVQKIHSFSSSQFVHDTASLVRDDSILMSVIYGIGLGMFGALLFVVAHILQTRHRGYSSAPMVFSSQQQHSPHHQTQWLTAERRFKKVVPKVILESFGIQTVLQTSSAIMLMTDVGKADTTASLRNLQLKYVQNNIKMEEGLEEVVARANTQRQGLSMRMNHLSPRTTILTTSTGSVVMQADTVNEAERFSTEELDGVVRFSGTSMSENPTLLSHGGTQMDMERITTAIMRVPQGQLTQLGLDALSMAVSSDGKPQICNFSRAATEEKKKVPFANADAQTMCSICQTEYEVGDRVRTLPCYHQYHVSCIDPWLLKVVSMCPICKKDLWPCP